MATGSAGILKFRKDVESLVEEFDEHTAYVLIAKKAQKDGYDITPSSIAGFMDVCNVGMIAAALPEEAREDAYAATPPLPLPTTLSPTSPTPAKQPKKAKALV